MRIEIYDNNTNETGTYKVWFSSNGKKHGVILSESDTNALLDMRQKEKFFMGQYKFTITSEFDIKRLVEKATIS